MVVPGGRGQAPVARRRLVARPRLFEALPGGGTADHTDTPLPRLVLVCAPAGFGKTTALTQWLHRWRAAATTRPRRHAWLSLDAADDDPRRLLAGLAAVLATAIPDAEAARLTQAAPDVVLGALLADLDRADADVVLAVDDYHLVESPQAHDLLARLADALPPHAALALATRADPPLPLARWRARGELIELRAADLRFTAAEATALLNDVMGLTLAAPQVEALQGRTEGWAAGLQLAAVSLRGRDDAAEFVDRFAGSHRFVLDYLVEEVLDARDDAERAFLFDTCVLDRMCAPLCNALTGRADGQATLEALEAANLFVVPLDDDRTWFRYHHLFAEALRARLAAADPERMRGRHRAAAGWLAGTDPDSAIGHAHAAGDPALAADLVEAALPAASRLRQDRTMFRWIALLPEAEVEQRPWLQVAAAFARLGAGDVVGAQQRLDAAEALIAGAEGKGGESQGDGAPDVDGEGDDGAPTDSAAGDVATGAAGHAAARAEGVRQLRMLIAMYRAAVAQAREDVDETRTQAQRVVDLAGPDDHLPRGAGLGFLGMAAWVQGRLPEAIDAFTECTRSMRLAGNLTDELGCTVPLALMWRDHGRPDEAARLLRRALERAESAGAVGLPVRGDLLVGLAACELDAADAEAAVGGDAGAGPRASRIGERERVPAGLDRAHPEAAPAAAARRDHLASAAAHLEAAHELGETASLPENRFRWFEVSARLREARGDLDGARQLLEEAQARYLPGFFPDLRPLPARLARVDLARGRLDLARDWARRAGIADAEPSYRRAFEHATLAQLLDAEGRSSEARTVLDQLLGAATDAGRGDAGVVSGGVASGGAPSRDDLGEQRLPDPLSDRERDVLRLLATELTGPQIAAQLYVSINTLRTHTRHIFTKLEVSTRAAAVRRGRELGLL